MAAALSQEEIEAGLMRKGFSRSHTDHRYFILYVVELITFLQGKNFKNSNDITLWKAIRLC